MNNPKLVGRTLSYTEEEDALLLKLRAKNIPYLEIGGLLHRSNDSLRSRVYQLKQQINAERWPTKDRIGFLDIEADSLDANFGKLLSWAIKDRGGPIAFDSITRREAIHSNKLDRRLVQSLVKEMREYDLLVGFYSGDHRFDFPFVRSRAMYWDAEFPGLGELYVFDLWPQVRNKMKLNRNGLENATKFLGIEGKSHIDPRTWSAAKIGERAAVKEVLAHNLEDVKITEQLFERLLPYMRITRTSI